MNNTSNLRLSKTWNLRPSKTLIVGDSLVHGLILDDCHVECFPGITTETFSKTCLSELLQEDEYSTLVLVLGTNDGESMFSVASIASSASSSSVISGCHESISENS